jgi:hypothetical protein
MAHVAECLEIAACIAMLSAWAREDTGSLYSHGKEMSLCRRVLSGLDHLSVRTNLNMIYLTAITQQLLPHYSSVVEYLIAW